MSIALEPNADAASYDSDQPRTPVVSELRTLYDYRRLIRILVTRDVTLRYRRTTLGAAWTLIQPLLMTAVMWVVFNSIFGRSIPGVPFIVYVLTGNLVVATFSQGVTSAGSSLVSHRAMLSKLYVPPEVFAYTATLSAGVHLLISLIPLVVAQVATGIGLPWTFLLLPLPIVCLLALVTGLGLIVAIQALRFHDVIPLVGVLVFMLHWLVPTFYPLDRVSPEVQLFIKLNPLYSYVRVVRGFAYEGHLLETQVNGAIIGPAWWNYLVMGLSAAIALLLGLWVFSRRWREIAVNV